MPSSRTAKTTRLRKSTDKGPTPRRLRFGAPQESDFQRVGNTVRFNPAKTALEKWLRLNAEFVKVWPNITMKKPPPPDSKDWEGKPDKFQFFSPNPGAGD